MANASIMTSPPDLTKEGIEVQISTNHVGQALLIRRLLPLIEKTAALPGAKPHDVTLASLGLFMPTCTTETDIISDLPPRHKLAVYLGNIGMMQRDEQGP
ncbi:Uu.00g022660.m01.CDS01 [Anthostomella pinea]|uniref:Uu.00g022660.m01.CDS01 n=1 Tax=Anthostomella pinea TaxID=933095 RepID=A0AAI8YNV9_9PEZI|nr:Uu.00g022660.m01.CDS01 [Anthostomella pinea]